MGQVKRIALGESGELTLVGPGGLEVVYLAGGCPHPECGCSEVTIRVMSPADGNTVAFVARLFPDLGELELCDVEEQDLDLEPPVDPETEALLDPLRAALDAELLDDFARFSRRLRGQALETDTLIREIELDPWSPGDKIAYEQVYDTPRIDCFREGDAVWEVGDFYCPDPGCACNKVTVAFLDSNQEVAAGSVEVDLEAGVVDFFHQTIDIALVPGLWKRYLERHRGLSRLKQRQVRMKAFGKILL